MLELGVDFDFLPKYRLIVCQRCRYTVWPIHVRAHLQNRTHKLPAKAAQAVAAEVLTRWPTLYLSPDDGFTPRSLLDEVLPQLPLYRDGLQCRLGDCSFVCRTERTIQSH